MQTRARMASALSPLSIPLPVTVPALDTLDSCVTSVSFYCVFNYVEQMVT